MTYFRETPFMGVITDLLLVAFIVLFLAIGLLFTSIGLNGGNGAYLGIGLYALLVAGVFVIIDAFNPHGVLP